VIRRLCLTAVLATAVASTIITGTGTSQNVALVNSSAPLSAVGRAPVVPPPPVHKCAPNFVTGSIGGQTKCLANGQLCQRAHAADYTRYGFTCTDVGNRFVLRKNTRTPLRPTPTAPPKPATPPVHHY
jgi:hypothetical protein